MTAGVGCGDENRGVWNGVKGLKAYVATRSTAQNYPNVRWINHISAVLLGKRREVSGLTTFIFRDVKCSAVTQIRLALLLKLVPDDGEEIEFGEPRLLNPATGCIDTSRTTSAQPQ